MKTLTLDVIHNRAVADQAAAAIQGMLPGALTERLTSMEHLRQYAKSKWFGRGEELRILRAEVAALALEFQAVDNQRAGEKVQAANHLEYLRLVGSSQQIRSLQMLLREHFRPEFEEMSGRGTALLEIVSQILLRIRNKV